MKHKLFYAVCCLLLFPVLNVAAGGLGQADGSGRAKAGGGAQNTSALPPPGEDGSGPLPPPIEDGSWSLPPPNEGPAPGAAAGSSGGLIQAAPAEQAPSGGSSGPGPAVPGATPAVRPAAPGTTPAVRPAAPGATPAGRPAVPGATPAGQAQAARSQLPATGLYWGAMAGGGFYNYEKHSYPYSPEGKAGFNAAFLWGMDYGLWALELDLLFTGDHLKVYVQNYDYKLTGTLIQIPVLFKLDFHLGRILLQPLAGVNLNFALGKIKSDFGEASYEPPLLGFTFGGVAGFRLGKGHILADLRYTSNLGDTKVNGGTETFERSAFMVFFGFQHYF